MKKLLLISTILIFGINILVSQNLINSTFSVITKDDTPAEGNYHCMNHLPRKFKVRIINNVDTTDSTCGFPIYIFVYLESNNDFVGISQSLNLQDFHQNNFNPEILETEAYINYLTIDEEIERLCEEQDEGYEFQLNYHIEIGTIQNGSIIHFSENCTLFEGLSFNLPYYYRAEHCCPIISNDPTTTGDFLSTLPQSGLKGQQTSQKFKYKNNLVDNINDLINVFPNPTSADFFLKLGKTKHQIETIFLYDRFGNRLCKVPFNSENKNSIYRVSKPTNINSGQYVLKIILKNNIVVSKKIIYFEY